MAFTYGEYSETGDYTIKEKKVKYVEYIESDGASYIDTGIIPTLDMTFYADYTLTNYNHVAFGSSEIIRSYGFYQSTNRVHYGGYTNITGYSLSSYGNRYQNTLTPTGYTLTDVTLGKTVNGDYTHTPSGTCKYSMRLFGEPRSADGRMYYAKCKIYEFKIWNVDNELIMHLKPCLDANNTPCMYDKVSQQYFYNQGTGTFTVGDYNLYLFADNQSGTATNLGSYRLYDMKIEGDSEGVTEGIDYVDCLIGDGNSYIDTGIVISNGYKIEITFMSTESRINDGDSLTVALFGASTPIHYSYDNNPYGISLGAYSYDLAVKNGGVAKLSIGKLSDTCYNKKYTHSMIAENVSNPNPLFLFALNFNGNLYDVSRDMIRIYDFKIYNAEGTLIQHLRPCVDTSKVPCMYDEVSQQYFYNQGSGTFGYKKKLRDFQPVLDSNNIPCLMDKINRKYYYDKNGNVFNSQEEVKYRRIPYIQGDGNSWLDIGQFNFDSNTRLEVKVAQPKWRSVRECIINNSGNLLMTLFNVGNDRLSYRVGTPYGGDASSFNLGINIPHVFTMTKTEITYDGNIIANPTSYGDISQTNIYLLKEWSVNTTHATAISQLYYFKIYQSDELVFDGIPVLDQDNIPGIYDLVTETFFYNQGTGEFSYDIEELECLPIDCVSYLELPSTIGGYKFDTGLIFDNTWSKIELKLNTMENANVGTLIETSNQHYTDSNFSLRYNYGVLFHISKTNGVNSGNFQIGTYSGILQKNTDITLTYTPLNWNINGEDYPMSVESIDSSTGTLVLLNDVTKNRIYSYKVWDANGDLIQHLQPSVDKNGVVFLYDMVSGNSIYCQKDTSLLGYGVPSEYSLIKYIESNGTQYIDTGVAITNNTDIEMTCRETTMIDYISNGLIFNLDGIKNTRSGHISDTTVWEDLSGNGLDFDLNDITITDSSMSFNGSTSYANIQDIELWKTIANDTTEYDVELCLRFTLDESYQPIISSNYGSINVAKFVKYLQFRSTNYGLNIIDISGKNYASNGKSFTVSCNMNDLLAYFNTTNYVLNSEASDFISAPISDNFTIGTRATGESFWFNGDIYSIRIYNRHLTDEERLYNHSVDVNRFGVETDIVTVKTGNYIMNNLCSQDTYKHQDYETNVQSNLTASEGATLTLGGTYLPYLSEREIEDATNDGWNLL